MKPVTTLYLLLLFCCPLSSFGQGENNVWCFDLHHALDFNNGGPNLSISNMIGGEGTASVCDASGSLLFYTNNETVWGRDNNIMPNGIGLIGSGSTTQGAVVVQSFTNPNQYYLFTLEATLQPGRLAYSVIDMTLNAGHGDIVPGQKNIIIDSSLGERMTVLKGNGCYYWILVHDVDSPVFHTFKFDYTGVNVQPVISNSGSHNSYNVGEIKASPGDTTIALAQTTPSFVELHSFDRTTGEVYNGIDLDDGIGAWYGVSYSPDGSRLYMTSRGNNEKALYQYDMSLMPDVIAVRNSRVKLDSSAFYSSIRKGPDSKIYIMHLSDISVINDPNVLGYGCNFIPNIFTPLGTADGLGHKFIASPQMYLPNSSHDTSLCFGYNIPLINAPSGYDTYMWSDGSVTQSDTFSGPGTKWVISTSSCGTVVDTFHVLAAPITTNSSVTDTTICLVNNIPTFSGHPGYNIYLWNDGNTGETDTMSQPGTKWVQAQTACNVVVDTFHLYASPIATSSFVTDTTICLVNYVPAFSAHPGYNTYLWSDGQTTQTDTMSQPGTKWVQAQTGCSMVVDTFHLHALPIAVTNVVKDTNVCFLNNMPILSASAGYNTYLWSDGMTTQQDTMSQPGTKWVQAQTGCTMVVDTFHVHDWRDTTKLAMDTSHCVAYSPIPVTAPGGYSSYTWSDGHIGQADTFFSTSTKWVIALNGCNMLIDTVHFTATTIPQDSVSMYGGDTTLCFDNIASVDVSGPSGYTFYLWNDGASSQSNIFNGPGIKWVYAQKLCYLLIDTFSVSAQPTDTTTSSTDTMICFSNSVTLSATSGYDTYLWSDGTTTQANTFTQTGIKEVYAHKACAERIDTFNVTLINDLSVDLGPDTSICKGETVTLDATSNNYPNAQYLWQDGKTTAVYHVSEGGDYSVTVSVGLCTASDTIRVHQKVIDVDLGKGLIPCHEESITLDAGVDSAMYLWQDGSTQRTIKATKAGSYSVKVTQGDCSATASVEVKYEGCPCNVIIPTAFSPNNDNKNDKFGVTLSCDIQSFRLMIYNRWGNRVFYSEDVNDKWDGTSKGIALDGDVFDYYAEFKDGEGKMYYYKGTVTLVR